MLFKKQKRVPDPKQTHTHRHKNITINQSTFLGHGLVSLMSIYLVLYRPFVVMENQYSGFKIYIHVHALMRHEPGTILINFSLSNRPLGVFVKPIQPMQCLFCVVHLQVVYEMKSNLNEVDSTVIFLHV